VQLEKNDRVFLMTDGVTEFFNSKSEAYGEKRLLNILSSTDYQNKLEEVIQKLVIDLDLFSNGSPASDDVTAMMFHYENDVNIAPQTIPNLGMLKELQF
jgi:sigma-B regulation protein RsbU (phosphoserine phosphatase)